MAEWPHYHAQHQEDRRLRRMVPDLPAAGVFLDVGAGEPVTLSNTYHFERCGLTGLLIDPDPRRCAELRTWRTSLVIECAIGPAAGEMDLQLSRWPGLSRAAALPAHQQCGTVRVPVRTLAEVCRSHGLSRADLLSLDTEGTEQEILQTTDLRALGLRWLIVEHSTIHLGCRLAPLRAWAATAGWRELCCTPANLVLCRPGDK